MKPIQPEFRSELANCIYLYWLPRWAEFGPNFGVGTCEQSVTSKTVRRRRVTVLVVARFLNIAVNDFDIKESVHCRRVLVLTALVGSGTVPV